MIQQDNFYLPFMGSDSIELAIIIKELLAKYKDYSKFSNPIIKGVYGNFNNIIWNGGRTIVTDEFSTIPEMEKCIKIINNNDLICRLTCTNQLLTENHLQDNLCNNILELISNTNNEIIVHSFLLENYIRQLYPNIPLISSITKGFDLNTFQEALKQDYKNVVCFYRQDILKYLETVSLKDQNKVELLLQSDHCAYCKKYNKHYEFESYNSLYNKKEIDYQCYKFNLNYNEQKEWFNLSLEERLNYNIKYFQWLNIHTYKIQGRLCNIDQLIDLYIDTLFYPYNDIRNNIKNEIKQLI